MMYPQIPATPQQDAGTLIAQVEQYVLSLGVGTWLWVALAFVLPAFLPRSFRGPFVAIAISLAFLPSSISVLVVLFVIAVVAAQQGLRRVPEGYAANVLRLGKYSRTLGPGLNFLIPGIESVHKPIGLFTYREDRDTKEIVEDKLYDDSGYISTKEVILDPPEHNMICSDNSVVVIDSIAYFRIVRPSKAAFGVERLGDALLKLIETVLRQEIGKLDADAVIASRELIGAKLQQALTVASEPWGTTVVRVEIQDISFQGELQLALTKAREAELAGRAAVIKAEREREALIAKAEGEKRAVELRAEAGLAEKRAEAEGLFLIESRKREGEAAGLRAVADALRDVPEAMVTLEAIKRQPEVAAGLGASNGLLVVPSEAAGLLGSLTALVSTWSHNSGRGPKTGK
jgi:regulator of protease activity HflC (stomatin/prohibitin superfamily)